MRCSERLLGEVDIWLRYFGVIKLKTKSGSLFWKAGATFTRRTNLEVYYIRWDGFSATKILWIVSTMMTTPISTHIQVLLCIDASEAHSYRHIFQWASQLIRPLKSYNCIQSFLLLWFQALPPDPSSSTFYTKVVHPMKMMIYRNLFNCTGVINRIIQQNPDIKYHKGCVIHR